jgi:cobyric acid synthase
VCGFKAPGGGWADFCGLCSANLQDPNEEMRVLATTCAIGGGGIDAYEIHVILTNKRIIFTGDESYDGTVETLGWIFGGIIGGLLGGAYDEAKSNNTRQTSIKFEDIESLEVDYSTKRFSRNAKVFTVCDKEGNTYFFQPGKNEAAQWETAIRNRLAKI